MNLWSQLRDYIAESDHPAYRAWLIAGATASVLTFLLNLLGVL